MQNENNMKRLVRCMLASTVCAIAVLQSLSVFAAENSADDGTAVTIDTSQDETYDVFTYRENDTGVTITSCDTAATDVILPEEIDGMPVTEIGEAAFMNCEVITDVVVPAHVTKIGESAFNGCAMLCVVTLPEGLTEIGKGAFESCTMLSQITLPSTLTELPDALFYNCSYIPTLELPDSITAIGSEAFYSCTALTEVTFSANLKEIGDYAFQNCQKLTEVMLPASCTALGKYVFDGCQALTNFTVEEGNTAYQALDGVLFTADGSTLIRYPQAKPETFYQVPETCEKLEDWSFIGSTILEEITLSNVQTIGEDCFYYCTSLKAVEIPKGVTELVGAVFGYCLSIEKIVLPDSMRTLGDHCFYACASLQKMTVPEGVTTLGKQCFYNCGSLSELELPSTITEIGEQAIGYYTPADAENNVAEKMDQLHVKNAGSQAVSSYMKEWNTGNVAGWIIGTIVLVVVAGVIVVIVLVYRSHTKIRVTSRHAPEKGKNKSKPVSKKWNK